MRFIRLTAELDIKDGGAPSEFTLLKSGINKHSRGELLFDEEAADSVMSRYTARGIQLMADYEHQSLRDDLTGPIPAAAKRWEPEVRDGDLIASNIAWTPTAARMLKDGEYRYFSIACLTEPESNRVVEIINFALTNLPAAEGIEPLVAASQIPLPTEEKNMKNVLIALGLAASAEETDALSAVAGLKDFERNVIALSGKSTRGEALGVLNALALKAARADQAEAELVALKAASAKREIEALIDAATLDGRVKPAQREQMTALAEKGGVDSLKICLSLLTPAAAPVTPPIEKPVAGAPSVDPEIAKLLKATGMTPEKFADARKQYRAVITQTKDAE